MNGAYQLALSLDLPPALSRDDFLVGDANRSALAAIDAWPNWAGGVLLLSGPPGSGKSHLVQVWRAASGAAELAGPGLTEADVDALAEGSALASMTRVMERTRAGPGWWWRVMRRPAARPAPLPKASPAPRERAPTPKTSAAESPPARAGGE